jgi:hypothetical protein
VNRDLPAQTYVAACVIALVGCVALFHARRPYVAPFYPLPDAAAHELYERAASEEVTARKKAAGRFRGSPWSQDDEFHSKEAKFIRAYSKSHRVPILSVVDALDRGMREHWETPPDKAPDLKVIPCRPRLTY